MVAANARQPLRPAAGQHIQERRVGCMSMPRQHERRVSVRRGHIQPRARRYEQADALAVSEECCKVQRSRAIDVGRINLLHAELVIALLAQDEV
jgi:hypothetical protein